MYTCDYCSLPIGPKVPLRLLSVEGSERHVFYQVLVKPEEDEDDAPKKWKKREPEYVMVPGTEIAQEFKVCPACAGVEIKLEAPFKPVEIEVRAPALKVSLGLLAVERLIEKTKMNTGRAQRDYACAYFHLKAAQQRGVRI